VPSKSIALIVYSPTLGGRRRVYIPEDDSQVPFLLRTVQPGEAVMFAKRAQIWELGPDEVLARYLGRQPQSDRCVLADFAGKVTAELHADPLIDTHPDGKLYADPNRKARVGDYVHNVGLV